VYYRGASYIHWNEDEIYVDLKTCNKVISALKTSLMHPLSGKNSSCFWINRQYTILFAFHNSYFLWFIFGLFFLAQSTVLVIIERLFPYKHSLSFSQGHKLTTSCCLLRLEHGKILWRKKLFGVYKNNHNNEESCGQMFHFHAHLSLSFLFLLSINMDRIYLMWPFR